MARQPKNHQIESEDELSSENIQSKVAKNNKENKFSLTSTSTTKPKPKPTLSKRKPKKPVSDSDLEEQEEEEEMEVEFAKTTAKKSKKRVSPQEEDEEESPREKKLRLQLLATTQSLEEITSAYTTLKDLRQTKVEQSEEALIELTSSRLTSAHETLQTYISENATLKSTIEKYRQLPNVNAHEALEELERMKVREEGWEEEMRVKEKEWREGEKARLREMEEEVKRTRAELSHEIAHSKSLQTQLNSGATVSTAPSADLEARLALNEDLTGFMVTNYRADEESGDNVYTCILNDCFSKGRSLQFKLTFMPNSQVSYQPDLKPERDTVLWELFDGLPLKGYMRFEAERCGPWFRSLFVAINRTSRD